MNRLILACASCILFIAMFFLLHTASFERIPPSVEIYALKNNDETPHYIHTSFFNPDNDIYLSAFDSSGLASYSVKITDKMGKVLLQKTEILLQKTEELNTLLPKIPDLPNGDEVFYHISVRDWSNANFFHGNESSITKHFIINKSSPQIQVIATSEQIVYGGSALIAFSISQPDVYKNIQESSIDKVIVSNGRDDFEAYPFINKQGRAVYLALIAWPLKNTFFNGTISVIDSAMNEKKIQIPINTNVNYPRRKFNINISDLRLQILINRLEKSTIMPQDLTTNIEKFQFFNESLRYQENQKIANLFQISKQMNIESSIPRFNVFNPVRDTQTSGHFGDEYTYKYNKEYVGVSVRNGIEFISGQDNSVINSNSGIVVYSGNIGSYGNLVAINYKLGLTAIYGYLHKIPTLQTQLQSLMPIGEMGSSGFAVANSLFFATLVQGHFVNPNEWLQAQWVNDNINQVLNKADNFGITPLKLKDNG